MKKLPFIHIRFPRIHTIKLTSKLIVTGFCLIFICASTITGAILGYSSALSSIKQLDKIALASSLGEQFILAEEDLAAGRYKIAQQRFVYILEKDANFPGAAEKLVEALKGSNLSNQIITNLPTPTLTPTPDLRPIEELYSEAINLINQHEWQKAIDTLASLRKSDESYQVSKVDGFMYLSLRYLGVEKIMSKGDLEGGIYDLALAEKFGPLDAEASSWQNLARMYMYGVSFWEVMPEQAVYYFGQVASAAPYLQDSSGWIAKNRYRSALIQYGDQLVVKKDWCKAVSQYSLALSIQEDNSLQNKLKDANDICSPPTETPVPSTITATMTETTIMINTPTWQLVSPTQAPTSTPTIQILITNTISPATATIEVPTVTQEPTNQPVPTETPTPIQNQTEIPLETPSS
ncbi:MAG: hypothetical protein GYA34_01875 [Chloroflexi bacterium]|nr:hypothetical protein [Chloroflexota bacterium]